MLLDDIVERSATVDLVAVPAASERSQAFPPSRRTFPHRIPGRRTTQHTLDRTERIFQPSPFQRRMPQGHSLPRGVGMVAEVQRPDGQVQPNRHEAQDGLHQARVVQVLRVGVGEIQPVHLSRRTSTRRQILGRQPRKGWVEGRCRVPSVQRALIDVQLHGSMLQVEGAEKRAAPGFAQRVLVHDEVLACVVVQHAFGQDVRSREGELIAAEVQDGQHAILREHETEALAPSIADGVVAQTKAPQRTILHHGAADGKGVVRPDAARGKKPKRCETHRCEQRLARLQRGPDVPVPRDIQVDEGRVCRQRFCQAKASVGAKMMGSADEVAAEVQRPHRLVLGKRPDEHRNLRIVKIGVSQAQGSERAGLCF
eukprot:scaffold1220_cov259-Pinguiococcus_pyrenoidosus.AAC.63